MSDHLTQKSGPHKTWQAIAIACCSLTLALGITLWHPWSASAAVTEVSITNLPATTGLNRVKPGNTISAIRFVLSPTSTGDFLVSTTFKINNVSNATTSDFNNDNSLLFGTGAILYIDKNNDGVLQTGPGNDVAVGLVNGSSLIVGATTTMSIDNDQNPGNGFTPVVVTNTPYILAFIMSATSTNGHAFSVSMAAGSGTYIVTSTVINSAGLTSGTITIDNAPPSALTTSSVPLNGSTFVPPDTMTQLSYSESMSATNASGTPIFTTTTVFLKALTGNVQGGAPTGPNLCSSLSASNNTSTITCTHGTLATSTWYMYGIGTTTLDIAGNALTTFASTSFQTGSFSADNNNTPPFVVSTQPTNGNNSFPTNGSLFVEFPASFGGVMATSGAGSVTSATNITLKTVTNGVPGGSNLLVDGNLSFASAGPNSQHMLKITPSSALTANTNYALTVRNTTKNSIGMPLNGDFVLFFKTSSGTDTSAPTFLSMMPASSTTGVPLNVGDVVVQYSKDMMASTISTSTVVIFADANNNSLPNAGESIAASTTVRYDSQMKAAHIGLKSILAANSKYCVITSPTSTDSIGNAMTQAVKCFTTTPVSFTASSPKVTYADGDNFKIWVAFDQPIDASDAINKSNFSVESPVGTSVNLTNATLNYRPEAKGVEITGIGLVTNQQFKVTVSNIRDLSDGATVPSNGTDNVGKGVVQDSTMTGGLVGGTDKPDFNQTNFATFWQNPQRCTPASNVAGKSGRMMCEFPTPAALTTGAQAILTFPTGFGIDGVSLIAAASSSLNADLNGPGPGITTITSLATSSAAGTVTLTLAHSGTAMNSGDQLRFEIDGVVNPTSAGSNSVSIIVKDSSGVKQGQTINAAPFTMNAAGSLTISGKVCKDTTSGGACGSATGIQGAKIFLDSPATGHQETVSASNGTYSFTSLSAGQYNIGLFLDPTLGSGLGGGTNMQNVVLTNSNATAIDFKKADISSSGKTLTVNITGGPATTEMDIFCFAPGNAQFSAPVMAKVTTNGSGVAAGTLTVQPNSQYQCGVGPHMPFDSFSSGATPSIPDFTFVPPPPQMVSVATSNLSVSFALTVTSQQINGKVTDGSGTAIANVYVDARPVGCFDTTTGALKDCRGASAQSKTDGTYALKVTNGTYQVSACAPGLPCTSPIEVTVKSDTSNSGTDNNSTADIYQGGTLVTSANGVVLKMIKSSLTISGQALDESGNAIKYAFVQAKKVGASDSCTSFTATGGDTGSPTDSSGNYTLYVSAGTWRVEGFAGTYGSLGCSMITITDTSKSSQNLQATASAYGTISGTVSKNSVATQGAQVNCYSTSGGNQTISGTDGSYSLKVKAGTYTCDGFLPGSGPLTPVSSVVVAGSGSATANLVIGTPGTITVTLGSTVTDAFCDARTSSGKGAGTSQNSSGTYVINVPAGTYTVRCGNPRIGEIGSTSAVVTASTDTPVSFTAPTLFTVSGRITDGTSNLEGAGLSLTDKTNGRSIFKQSDATSGNGNNVSITIPAGTYSVTAAKAGYVDSSAAETLVVSANTSITTRSLTKATVSAALTVQASSANYTGNAKVVATRSNDNKISTVDVDKTNSSSANASLPLTDGTWSVVAYGDNGNKSAAATITVSGGVATPSSATLDLSVAITGFTAVQSQQPVVPSTGGLFKDANISSGFEVNIPTGALSTSDATAGSLETQTDPTHAISTPGKSFLGTSAISITPKTSGGQKISELASAATIKIPYSESDIPAGITENELKCAVWSDASSEWETLPTTVDTDNNILTCQTTHFSTFGAIAGTSGGTTSSSGGSSGSGSSGGSSGGGGGATTVAPTLPTVKSGSTSLVTKVTVDPTDAKQITLNFAVDNVALIAISNTADFAGQSYQNYTSEVKWTLSSVDQKLIYLKFRSASGGLVMTQVPLTGATQTPVVAASEVVQPVAITVSNNNIATSRITLGLKSGSKSDAVLALQQKLQALGFLPKTVKLSTQFGAATQNALKAFQKAKKVAITGVYDAKTAVVLEGPVPAAAPVVVAKPTAVAPVVTVTVSFNGLKSGSKGAAVTALQQKLQALGFLPVTLQANGQFGPATVKALKAFQKANKLSQTGSVGSLTLKALEK